MTALSKLPRPRDGKRSALDILFAFFQVCWLVVDSSSMAADTAKLQRNRRLIKFVTYIILNAGARATAAEGKDETTGEPNGKRHLLIREVASESSSSDSSDDAGEL